MWVIVRLVSSYLCLLGALKGNARKKVETLIKDISDREGKVCLCRKAARHLQRDLAP
jgi:hypothetical protein